MKITITNTFHSSAVTLNMKNNELSVRQVKRAVKELCGIDGCMCGSMWSSNHTDIGEGYENCHFEPANFDDSGNPTGAVICKN